MLKKTKNDIHVYRGKTSVSTFGIEFLLSVLKNSLKIVLKCESCGNQSMFRW